MNGLRTIFISFYPHTGELFTLLIRYLLVYLTQIIVFTVSNWQCNLDLSYFVLPPVW